MEEVGWNAIGIDWRVVPSDVTRLDSARERQLLSLRRVPRVGIQTTEE